MVRVYLSNADMRNLCNEIRDDLLLILYELTSPIVQNEVLNKLKSGQFMDFKDVLNKIHKSSNVQQASFNWDNPINGVQCHITTIERVGKYRYKLHFVSSWELDIFVNDVRKLSHMRQLLMFKDTFGNPMQGIGEGIPASGFSGIKLLIRERVQKKQTIEQEPNILVESEDENDRMGIPLEDKEDQQDKTLESQANPEKKPLFDYRYSSVTNLGRCFEVHVLKRPKRPRT